MPYETPITIKQALTRIEDKDYVLPAIQREFVWGHDRIVRLFDSLMRNYPIGGFLLWRLTDETASTLDLYQFLDRYNEHNHRHNPPLKMVEPRGRYAVLDGQQRLTALNLALRGTYAYRLPRKWDRPENYPTRKLYLNLCEMSEDAEEGEGMRYLFEFLTPQDAAGRSSETAYWFPVPEVLQVDGIADQIPKLTAAGLTGDYLSRAAKTLERLRDTVQKDLVIAAHVEEDQDLDRVLDIFIRVNSAGMTLSSSDLLLSIATARWRDRDARESIHSLVDALNSTGHGFGFTKDHVLKAALVLTDAGDIRFKASNINHQTMARVEEGWDAIEAALKLAAEALSAFGFSEKTLTAHSVAIPLADYFHQRQLTSKWVSSEEFREDRQTMRRWVLQTLLKQGVWGAGLDTLLTTLRKAVRDHATKEFPASELTRAMASRGRHLTFPPEEIDALSTTRYGPRAFAVLAALYPGFDGTKAFHVDHVFPRREFKKKNLAAAGLASEDVDRCVELRDDLPNLQLLEGMVNTSKQATMPTDWMDVHFADDLSRQAYVAAHDLQGIPEGFDGFLEFYETRRQRIRKRLEGMLTGGLPSAT